MMQQQFDVAIVGASIAGCAAATLFARRGLRVALIERNTDLNAYKKFCTHSITGVSTPIIRKLGLDRYIEAAGAIRNSPAFNIGSGWIADPDHDSGYGYNIRRQTLDPLLRRIAIESANATYFPGHSAVGLLKTNQQVNGLNLQNNATKETFQINARLVVAADGRNSAVARMAGVKEQVHANNRFGYFAHYRNLKTPFANHSQFWVSGRDVAYTFPNDDDVTLVACIIHKDELEAFKEDIEGNFKRFIAQLPDAPDLTHAERITPMIGIMDVPNIYRDCSVPGLALIGDAILASDPLWGAGIGWALVSADWLVEQAAPALLVKGNLENALKRYRRQHFWTTLSHRFHINWFATGRTLNILEKIYFNGAAKDTTVARMLHAYGARKITFTQLMLPWNFARALAANLKTQPAVQIRSAIPSAVAH